MFPTKSILLTGAALIAASFIQFAPPNAASAQSAPGTIILAQQEPSLQQLFQRDLDHESTCPRERSR